MRTGGATLANNLHSMDIYLRTWGATLAYNLLMDISMQKGELPWHINYCAHAERSEAEWSRYLIWIFDLGLVCRILKDYATVYYPRGGELNLLSSGGKSPWCKQSDALSALCRSVGCYPNNDYHEMGGSCQGTSRCRRSGWCPLRVHRRRGGCCHSMIIVGGAGAVPA